MKLFAALAVLAFSSCAATPARRETASAVPYKVAGTWKGTYSYPDYLRHPGPGPVEFQFELKDSDKGFHGKSREPNTFGDRAAAELMADIDGYLMLDGHFHFYKKMDGTGGVGHTIEYDGQLSPDGTTAEGHWFIPGSWSGKFRMERQ